MSVPVPATIGVVGAGTMGAGIAQLAAQAGARTLLHDPFPEALERGIAYVRNGVGRQVEKGRLSKADGDDILSRLTPAADVSELSRCGLIIEAVPERLDLKLDLLKQLADLTETDCVLATNTSSLSVTELAAATPHPERVVGMHFFNPAPVMKLMEVVAGEQTGEKAIAVARAVGEAMGKRVIDAADIAGFLVNRVNRPFFLESLQILQGNVADVEQIDRILRMAGGFRMGPFELMDLIGIDTNHAVAVGFQAATFGEPRYRPSPLAARKVAAGHLGRKTGRGWYDHQDGPHTATDPEPTAPGGGDGRILVVRGDVPIAAELRTAAATAGFDVHTDTSDAWLTLDCTGWDEDDDHDHDGPTARLLFTSSLHELDPHAAGFSAIAPLGRLIETTTTPLTDPAAAERLDEFIRCLGRVPERTHDAPGLVLARVVAQLVNEAAFLIGEGNGTPEDVDAGMELGVNHPRGPVAWSRAAGLDHILGVLDALHVELGDDRYRAAPLLRRANAIGATL